MADSGRFVCVVKKEHILLSEDNQPLPISNIGALRMSLEALQKEDASDDTRAEQLWNKAFRLLAEESQDDDGPAAQGSVQVSDDFDVASIGGPVGYYPICLP